MLSVPPWKASLLTSLTPVFSNSDLSRRSSLCACLAAVSSVFQRMFPLKLRRSSLLARADSAYRCVAGSLFSPRCAEPLARPLSFWICQVSICLLLPSSHTWFELLRKIYPSTLQGWIALDWHSGTNFRGAKKENPASLQRGERGLWFDFTVLSLMKIILYEIFFISLFQLV